MNFLYTINPESDEPIMLVNKHIGFDAEELPDPVGVMGDQVEKELYALDEMGKRRIKMYINSPGGSVTQGMSIFSAMQKTKTPVDTYCTGICASIAGVIFQGGRKRYIADYGKLMYHNPFVQGGGSNKGLDEMKDSIVKMVATKRGMDEVAVSKMMDATTWIGAANAISEGYADEIENSKDFNKKYVRSLTAKDLWKESNVILNNIFKNSDNHKNSNMEFNIAAVTNKLGLNPDASEANIVKEITNMVNRATVAEQAKADLEIKLTEKDTEAKNALSAHQQAVETLKASNKLVVEAKDKEISDLKNDMTDKLAEFEAMKQEKVDNEAAALSDKCKNMVEGFARVGRIKNDEATITGWVNKAKEDFDGVKALIEGLPINAKAPVLKVEGSNDRPSMNAANKMQEIRDKIKI